MTRRSRSHETIVLPRWLRWSLYAASLMLAASGVVWLFAHFLLANGDPVHPLEPWAMRVHGFAVMPALFLYGSLLRSHMIKAWNARMNRMTGLLVAGVLALLTITGYLLYYAGGEQMRAVTSVLHWVMGLLFVAALPLHIWVGRRRKLRRARSERKESSEHLAKQPLRIVANRDQRISGQ